MKSSIVGVLFLMISVCVQAQEGWSIRDSVNGPGRAVSSCFVAYGQGWVVSGLNDSGFKRKMYSYNPFQDDWDDEPSIGGISGDGLERGSAVGFSINNKGYICLGQGDFVQYASDLWEYDPASETWSQKADFSGEARRQAVAFTVGDYAYVGTGQAASGFTKDFFKYDPTTNSWSQISDFGGTPRKQAIAFTMGADGYVGTGDDGIYRDDFWQYHVLTDTWIQKANFPGTPRAGAVAWGYATSGMIGLGEDNTSTYRKDVWQYYYYSNTWVQRSDFLGSPRKNAIAFVINGLAFVGTGYDGNFKDDFYSYNSILGLGEEKLETTSTCFPNPTQDKATVFLSNSHGTEFTITVFSITGEKLNIPTIKSGGQFALDLSQLPSGNYIYRLTSADKIESSTGKITKL